MTKQTVISQALKLPEAERLEVVEALYESLEGPVDPDVEQAWDAEIQRRLCAIDSGKAKMLTWEEARKQITGESNGDTDAD